MPNQPYLPIRDSGKATWLEDFALKLPALQGLFGLSNAQITSVQNDAKMFRYILNYISAVEGDTIELTKYKNLLRGGPVASPTAPFPEVTHPNSVLTPFPAVPTLVPADIFGRMGDLAETLKRHANYTVAIGGDLKIIGAGSQFDPATFKPKAKATAQPGMVKVDFEKNETDGSNIYAQLVGETAWLFLGLDTSSPYFDTRPLAVPNVPEIRRYRVRGVIDNVEIGLFSDEVMVTFGG